MRIEEKNGNLVIVDFNELEALKIASRIENDGIRFYTRLAASAGAPKVRETLELLAFQEKDHLEFFRKELQRLREKREDPFEEDDLLDSIDYGIFQPYQSMADLEKALDTPRKALKLGLIVEEKSIQFYQSCREHVTSRQAKRELGGIIEEERGHKRMLQEMLAGLP